MFSFFSSQMPTHFSVSKSMACWINLSPLCVAMTRQSSDFMAEWISVIKETTSKTICLSHPSVITQRSPSAAHHSKTTASHGEKAGGGGGAYATMPLERDWGGGGETRRFKNEGWGMWVKLNEGKGVKRQSAGMMANTTRKRKLGGDSLLFYCCPTRSPTVMLPCCAHRCLTESVLPALTCLWSNFTRAPVTPLITHYSPWLCFYKNTRPKQTAEIHSSFH